MKHLTCMFFAAAVGGAWVLTPAAGAQDATNPPAAAKPAKAPKEAASLSGTLESVNVETGELKISVKHKTQSEEKTVQTDKSKVQVKIDGAEATLADLKPGMKLKITPATGMAAQIDATAAPTKKDSKKAEKPAANADDEPTPKMADEPAERAANRVDDGDDEPTGRAAKRPADDDDEPTGRAAQRPADDQ